MTTVESPADSPGARPARRWRDWAQVLGLTLIVLLLSEALWLWQTWPVRELLQPAVASAPPAGSSR
jgi:hypothetical protein